MTDLIVPQAPQLQESACWLGQTDGFRVKRKVSHQTRREEK